MQTSSYPRSDYLWLSVILILAAVLRLIGLDAPLWFDEIVTVESHLKLPWTAMMQDYSMNHHYFFSLQSKLSTSLFGQEIWAIRLPAVLFGIGTVAAIWWLAREIAGSGIAHISALLVATSYHQIWFSQNARGYTELAFWSTLGMIFFLRGMRSDRPGIWVAYGITLAAAVFTHLTGAFFFAAQGLVWLGYVVARAAGGSLRREQVTGPLIGFTIGAILTLICYALVLPDVLATVSTVSNSSAIDRMQEYQNPIWTVVEGLRTAVGSGGGVVSVIGLGVVLTAAIGTLRTYGPAPLFAPVVLMHVVLTAGLLVAVGMRVWPRFFFVDVGLLLILIVCGVTVLADLLARILDQPGLARPLLIAGAVAMVLVSAALAVRNYRAPKQDLAGAYSFVEDARSPGERVYSVGFSGPLFIGHFGADWGNLMSSPDLQNALSEPGPVMIVVPFPDRSYRMIPELADESGTGLKLVQRFPGTLGDGYIVVLRRE